MSKMYSAQAKTDWLIETYSVEELRVVWKWYADKVKLSETAGAMSHAETREMFKLVTQVGWAMAHPLSVARQAQVDYARAALKGFSDYDR